MSDAETTDVNETADEARTEEPGSTTFMEYAKGWWLRVRTGDIGALPIIVGLILIVIIFGSLRDTFLTERNFTNLLLQMSPTAILAIGVVWILLIAEIDLSVAYVSAVGGVIMALMLRPGDPGMPWPVAVGVALLVTTMIGFLYGQILTKLGVPSFVITLAGNLAFFGVVLILTTQWSTAGTTVVQDSFIIGLANNFLADWLGWALGIVVVGGYAASELIRFRSRNERGLTTKPLSVSAFQVGGIAVITFGAIYYANLDRGVPMATVILGFFLAFWTFIATKTSFGRHVYAVGGNPEAARRAGINVSRLRVYVFMINGFMAGIGGIMLASRLRSVATNSGGGALLLNVIAAAVIGGTSLFGGHGRIVSAFYGAIVIAAIQNGMDLLGLNTGTKFVITGLVLLAAVTIDSLAQRGRASSGVA
jgi:D-xylose transport system permease protein